MIDVDFALVIKIPRPCKVQMFSHIQKENTTVILLFRTSFSFHTLSPLLDYWGNIEDLLFNKSLTCKML